MPERTILHTGIINSSELIKNQFFDNDKFLGAKFVQKVLESYPYGYFITPLNETGGDVIWMFNEEKGIYQPNGIPWIEDKLKTILGNSVKRHYYSEVVKHLQVATYTHPEQFFIDYPQIIVFENGTYNLTTNELELHNHEYLAKSRIPHCYDPDAQCPEIVKTLVEIIGEDIATLQEWLGYHLYRDYPIHKVALYVGTGSNGKTQVLNLIEKLVGKENTSSVSLYELTTDKFAAAELYGKLANLAPDVGSEELKYTGRFKGLTGQDSVRAQKKYQSPFSFYNYAKMNFACNQVPKTPDNSDAFFRRFLLFQFNNKFVDEEVKEQSPLDETLKLKKTNIMEKICTKSEMSGFVTWCLRGLKRLLRNGKFTNQQTTEEIREYYVMMSNPILGFIMTCLQEDPHSYETVDAVYKAYVDFCKNNGFVAEHKSTFGASLSGEITYHKERKRIGNSRVNCYVGIRLLEGGHSGHSGHRSNQPFHKLDLLIKEEEKGSRRYDHPDRCDQENKIQRIIRQSKNLLSLNQGKMEVNSFYNQLSKVRINKYEANEVLKNRDDLFLFQGPNIFLLEQKEDEEYEM